MEEICQLLNKDILMIETFFRMASKPLVDVFGGKKYSEKIEEDISNFITCFVRNNTVFFKSIRKIIRFASKKSQEMELFEFNCPV